MKRFVCLGTVVWAATLALNAQTKLEDFEYPTPEDLLIAWTGSGNAIVSATNGVSSQAVGPTALRVDFNFPSLAFTTEFVTGPTWDTPIAIQPQQYVSFRVLGDPAFKSADFRNLYLYAYDVDGNFGRWGAPVPTSGTWQVFNFVASTIEKPWNSPALPDLNQIVRLAFYQYGSEKAIAAYSASIALDEVSVRDTPLAEPPPVVESVVETFDYAGNAELTAAWKGSSGAQVQLSDAVAAASVGTNALRVVFNFPSVEFATETVTGPQLSSPVSVAPGQYVSFRVKGDPAFAAADFRNLYLYAYDASGNFGRWGAPVPTSAEWQILNFAAHTIEKPWDSPALPNLGNLVKFAFFQYGSEQAIAPYSATVYLDEIRIGNSPFTDPAPIQERLVEGFEYTLEEELLAAWTGSLRAVLSLTPEVAPRSLGTNALKIEFTFPSGEWATESVSGPTLAQPIAIGTSQYLTFRLKGDPAFSAADFRNLYLYAYDTEGNFGRWGSEVPATGEWKIFNFAAGTLEKPWNSVALPNLNQINRFAFFQYGSQAAIEEYAATLTLDDLQVRNAPLVEFPAPAAPRVLIDDFESYADAAALRTFYSSVNSPATTTTTASLASPAAQGSKALELNITFAPGMYPWGSVRSSAVTPFSFPTNAVASFRFKGDASLALLSDPGTSVWLSFYDANGGAIHHVRNASVVTSDEWVTVEARLADFGDTSSVDVGNLVGWRILVQGWEGTVESSAQPGTFLVDDVRIAVPNLQVSGVPPAGFGGAPLTNLVVDEANRIITADLPTDGTQGYLTITPNQELKSISVENGKLVVRW